MAYGTATIERQNGNGQHAARTDEVETLRRERDAAEARAQAARRTLIDMRRVLTQTGWNPAQRIQYAMLQARVDNAPGDGPAAVLEGGARQWSKQLGRGFGEQTVSANLAALQRAGLLQREERKQKMPDGTVKTVYSGIHVWRTLPAELPATLEDGPRRENARTTSDKQRALYRALKATACPECGTVGEFVITCTACGTALQDEARETLPASETDTGPDAVLDAAVAGGDGINDAPGSAPEDPWADVWPTVTDDGRETLPAISRGADFLPAGETEGGRETAGEAAGIIDIRNGEETLPAIAAPDALVHLTGPTMTGAVTLNYFAEDGAAFTFAAAGGKHAIEKGWPDKPHGLRDALAHLKHGNVGILSGAGGLAVIDLDEHAGEFLRAHPVLASAPLVFRRDAPERVKIIIRLEGEAGEYFTAGKDARRKVEYLASGHHGIVAGTHASGATIEVRPGEMPTMTGEAARAICAAWADVRPPIIEPPARISRPATSATASSTTGSGLMSAAEIRAISADAIAWANADADIRGAVDTHLAKLPRDGKYYSIRPDDRHPSATWGDCDGQRRIMRDFGRVSAADAAMDDFELWTRWQHNGDKRAAVRAAIRMYCTAKGKAIPAWAEVKR